jgi:hypothetical protein
VDPDKLSSVENTRVQRKGLEIGGVRFGRTLASTYVLHSCELLIQYFGVPESKSGVQGTECEFWVGVPDVQVDRKFRRELRKTMENWDRTYGN